LDFEEALPRLLASYEAGQLVPFLGAGMSVPACPKWPQLIENLEREAAIEPERRGKPEAVELVRRANAAVRTLKLANPGCFAAAVEKALVGTGAGTPAQTEALARTWWPLVLTTNYDGHFLRAYTNRHGPKPKPGQRTFSPMLVRGRRPQDCLDVLSSLTAPSDSVLWALQGFLAPRGVRADVSPALSEELVIGHEEYRRVTHREPQFRKAFAEVYRSRSLLFVGSGLQESYLLELFGEILELYGPNPRYHHALVRRGHADVEFLLARFNTIAVEYAEHDDLPGLLGELNRRVVGRRSRKTRWAYAVCEPDPAAHETEAADVSVVRGKLPLPDEARDHEPTRSCIALSAGGGGTSAFLGPAMTAYVGRARKLDRVPTLTSQRVADSRYVWRFGESPLFCVVAREKGDVRDVRCIAAAVAEFCDVASGLGYRLARFQLLSGGPGRVFPPRMSLVQMIRGYSDWRGGPTVRDFSIALHLVDPNLLFELTTGRIDVVELLTCPDVRFWVEIVMPSGEVERHLQHCIPESSVADIARRFAIPQAWTVEVVPAARRADRPHPLAAVPGPGTIASIGVVPGSTMRFAA
jgi:hypothetical protein